MKRIKANLKKRLEQINVWKAECQLLLMVLGCISAVAVFVRNLFMGKVEPPGLNDVIDFSDIGLKGIGSGGGGGGLGSSPLSLPNLVQPLAVVHSPHHAHSIFMYANIAIIVVLLGLIIYFGIKVFNKWRLRK